MTIEEHVDHILKEIMQQTLANLIDTIDQLTYL